MSIRRITENNMAANDTRIFGIGTSGLVGSRVTELLADSYQITPHSSKNGFDITDTESLGALARDLEHSLVIHMAAKTDVDGCEKDKSLGESGDAWRINVTGTANVVGACKKSGKKIIYISTDFVFGGEDTPTDGYSEEDMPAPINWYARTKYTGEKIVSESGLPYLILRIAYPYRKAYEQKKDFVRAVLGRLSAGQKVQAITDHIMTPTFIDDIAYAIKTLLDDGLSGIFHVVGSEFLTPYDAVVKIAEAFHLDYSLVVKTTRQEFFSGRAPRPFNLTIKNDKIERLGVRMRTFSEGLEEIKQ